MKKSEVKKKATLKAMELIFHYFGIMDIMYEIIYLNDLTLVDNSSWLYLK